MGNNNANELIAMKYEIVGLTPKRTNAHTRSCARATKSKMFRYDITRENKNKAKREKKQRIFKIHSKSITVHAKAH